MRRLATKTLAGVGEVVCAANIKEGLLAAYVRQPKAILLDVLFDGSPAGMAAIQAFRAVAPDAEIIVLTCEYIAKDEARAIALGAMGYVEKGDVRVVLKLVTIAIETSLRRVLRRAS